MEHRLACSLSTPARGGRPRYDQAIEYALSLPKGRCVWVILDPLIKRMSDRFRFRHMRFRFDGCDSADPHILTVPNEKIRFVYPIRSSSIHNLSEVRRGKVLIFRL